MSRLYVLSVAAALAIAMASATSALAQQEGVIVAVDARTSGNGPRTVGQLDECVSLGAGQSIAVDIVIPGPGVPSDRGAAAFQFTLLYDPAVVWVQADDIEMLLSQAVGSSVIPIADPKPDTNGTYQSWGIDFGSSGIEPAGTSEVGPGVIARVTLLAREAGTSSLTLSNVLVIDDAGERITIDSLGSGSLVVGGSCPGDATDQPSPGVDSVTATPPTPSPAPAQRDPDPPHGAARVPAAGGAPPSHVGSLPLVAAGLLGLVSGAALMRLAGTAAAKRGRAASSLQERQQ